MSAYIKLSGVNFVYEKTGFSISDVSLELCRGKATALTGCNGSGKTTLGKLIMGILKPDSGSIFVDGQDIKKLRLFETAKKIGYLFQNPERQIFCATALEEIMFSLQHSGEDRQEAERHALELLARLAMRGRKDDHPLKLSRGEKQRLALLCVFAMDPPYFILDEPTAGLDANSKCELISMLDELKDSGVGILIITHDRELIERAADSVITMSGGRIHEGA